MDFIQVHEMRTTDPVREGKRIREALAHSRVLHIVPGWHISDLRGFYDTLTDASGECVRIGEDFAQGGVATGEKWLENRYDADIPDTAAYRHSKNAQPLHTDESYDPAGADIMFFYCVNRAPAGGGTTFVDGPVLVDLIKQRDAQLLEDLLSTEVTYSKGGRSRTSKIIRYDEQGTIRFNYNYYCVEKSSPQFVLDLNQRFHDFLQNHVVGSDLEEQILLQPGEAVAWWDELVLHGRASFCPEKTNDRFIWKTGIRAA